MSLVKLNKMIELIKPTKSRSKPKLLLHTCCACCATEVYNRLKDNFEVTLFWYNPNIYPYEEYKRRFNSFIQLASDLDCDSLICHSEAKPKNLTSASSRAPKGALWAKSRDLLNRSLNRSKHRLQDDKISEIDDYKIDNKKWQSVIAGLENEPEGGRRCVKCFEFRLEQTAKVAKENGFDVFTTTLTISPHKNAKIINMIGKEIAEGICHPEFISGSREMLKLVQHDKKDLSFLVADFKKQDGFKKSIELSHKHKLYRQSYCGCIYSFRN